MKIEDKYVRMKPSTLSEIGQYKTCFAISRPVTLAEPEIWH